MQILLESATNCYGHSEFRATKLLCVRAKTINGNRNTTFILKIYGNYLKYPEFVAIKHTLEVAALNCDKFINKDGALGRCRTGIVSKK